jgi:hypothetical protein
VPMRVGRRSECAKHLGIMMVSSGTAKYDTTVTKRVTKRHELCSRVSGIGHL